MNARRRLSSGADLDASLLALRAGARTWARLALDRKIALLEASRVATGRVAQRWTAAAAAAKGITGTPLEGEETLSGAWAVLTTLDHLLRTLREIEQTGAPALDERALRVRPDGQVVADVFPTSGRERFLLRGVRAEVWMEPGLAAERVRDTMGVWYRQKDAEPRVTLVLGAGNVAAIPALDVLAKLVADGSVCLLKLNPINEYLGPILEEAFAPLVEGGYLRLVYGGADVGAYLCTHPGVDAIHVTGSKATHDAIVLGSGGSPAKPVTSELGCVTPAIVVPGEWSDADVRVAAEQIATQKLHNDGFNCISLQVLILPRAWERTRDLLAAIETVMRGARDRLAYYPGAEQRFARIAAGHPSARSFGRSGDGFVPRTVVQVDPADAGEGLFDTEAFCSVLAVAQLDGDARSYLRDAVDFANERLAGTLGASLIAHPRTLRDEAPAIDAAVARLRYGCIGVNAWCGVGFLLPPVPWGAFPGNTPADCGSGIGVVHNSRLFSRTQKSVVYAPFAQFPKPPWFVTNRRQREIAQALCGLERTGSPLRLAQVAALALGG